jgi:hypothetical protein
MKNRTRSQEKSFFFEKIMIVLEFWGYLNRSAAKESTHLF